MRTKLTITIKTDEAGQLFIGNVTKDGDGIPPNLVSKILGALADIQDDYNIENGYAEEGGEQ